MLKSLGVVLIATGKYVKFIDQIIESINNSNHTYDLNFYIFTDEVKSSNFNKLNYYYWEKTKWPFPTLLRYHKIYEIKDELMLNDFLIYLDVDMKVNELPIFESNQILAVQHPGYVNKKKKPFESNPASKAYFLVSDDSFYVCGGVQGGDAKVYINICDQIKSDIDFDLRNNFIPRWHDESYWNKYVNNTFNKKVLNRSFCWPEHWITKNTPGKIIALKKQHLELRSVKNLKVKISLTFSDLIMKLRRPRHY